jgi:hypothetical protein
MRLIWMLLSIAVNRGLDGDPCYIRCARCGTIASELEGASLQISSMITIRRGEPASHIITPPEWDCPSCGCSGPLEVGEQLPADARARCRHTFLCRCIWNVPAAAATVTCPRCYTRQPARHIDPA